MTLPEWWLAVIICETRRTLLSPSTLRTIEYKKIYFEIIAGISHFLTELSVELHFSTILCRWKMFLYSCLCSSLWYIRVNGCSSMAWIVSGYFVFKNSKALTVFFGTSVALRNFFLPSSRISLNYFVVCRSTASRSLKTIFSWISSCLTLSEGAYLSIFSVCSLTGFLT